jgi:transcriptional regulator with XRE-family HTH domain
MFKNLERLLLDKGISKKEYAEFLGVNEKTVQNKLKGISEFSFPEAMKTQKLLFPEYRIEYLFLKSRKQDNRLIHQ